MLLSWYRVRLIVASADRLGNVFFDVRHCDTMKTTEVRCLHLMDPMKSQAEILAFPDDMVCQTP